MPNLQQPLPKIFKDGAMSMYNGSTVTDQSIVRYSLKIRHAFPSLPPEFYGVLLEMVKEEGFTEERFRDAVHHVIKNCVYPTPTVAQFISFDKRVPVFTYDQMLKKLDESGMGMKFWENYKSFQFKDLAVKVWIHVNNVKQYNISEEY